VCGKVHVQMRLSTHDVAGFLQCCVSLCLQWQQSAWFATGVLAQQGTDRSKLTVSRLLSAEFSRVSISWSHWLQGRFTAVSGKSSWHGLVEPGERVMPATGAGLLDAKSKTSFQHMESCIRIRATFTFLFYFLVMHVLPEEAKDP